MYKKVYNEPIKLTFLAVIEGEEVQKQYSSLECLVKEYGRGLNEVYYKNGGKMSDQEVDIIRKLHRLYYTNDKRYERSLREEMERLETIEQNKLEIGRYVYIITNGFNTPVEIEGIVERFTKARIKLEGYESVSFQDINSIEFYIK